MPSSDFVSSPHFLTLVTMAHRFGRLPSDLFRLRDETVSYAFDVAATLVVHRTEVAMDENRQASLIGALAGPPQPQVEWESVEEF